MWRWGGLRWRGDDGGGRWKGEGKGRFQEWGVFGG